MGTKEGAKKGREKGKRWERQFAVELSQWYSDGKDKNIFRRSIGSRAVIEAESQARDIIAMKQEGYDFTSQFDIELKDGKISLWKNFINGVDGEIYKWWELAEIEKVGNKGIILVIKNSSKRGKPLVVIGEVMYQQLLCFFGNKFSESLLKWRVDRENWLFIFSWEDWKQFDPGIFSCGE